MPRGKLNGLSPREKKNLMKIIKHFEADRDLADVGGASSCQTVTTESITVEVPTVETAARRGAFEVRMQIAC
mgnify:CR=1 FL=1